MTTRYLWAGFDAEAEALNSSLAVAHPRSPTEEPDLRSVDGGERAWFYVGNLTSHELTVYWLDHDGERKRQGTVEAGRMIPLGTYTGHPCVVTGPDDTALAVYLPEPGGSLALVR